MLDLVSALAAIRGLKGLPPTPPAINDMIRNSAPLEVGHASEANYYLVWMVVEAFRTVYGQDVLPRESHVSTRSVYMEHWSLYESWH